MREEHRQGRLIVDAKTSLQEYLNNWLKVVQPSLSAKTFSDYERYVTQVIGPLLGKKVLSKLAPLDVQGLYQSFTTEGRKPRWIKYVHQTLHKALADAVNLRILPENVADRVSIPRLPRREYPTWTPEQLQRFLTAIQGDPDESVYVVTIATGFRAGEVFGLQWGDVD